MLKDETMCIANRFLSISAVRCWLVSLLRLPIDR